MQYSKDEIDRVLVSNERIQARLDELAERVNQDYAGRELLLVCILKGAVAVFADMLRRITIPCQIDFMAISSYGSSTKSSGVVRIMKDLDHGIEGKDVLIADDILATGDSMLDLARELKRRKCGRIFMATTFAMFTNGIEVFKKAYAEGLFDYILATNLSYLRPELREQPWFIEVDMSKYIALIIATLNHDRSISPLLNPLQRIQKLLTRHRAALMEQNIK